MAVKERSPADTSTVARRLVETLGGRFSVEMGIDVDKSSREVERWLLAATLFGTRISATIAIRTYRVLTEAGVRTLADIADRSWDDLVELLDRAGYVRYDFRTATRLQKLAAAVTGGGGIAGLRKDSLEETRRALDALPGWGPVTVAVFLRELRGVWPGIDPPLDDRAAQAARHLGLATGRDPLPRVRAVAERERLDLRDLEAALVRLFLAHHRDFQRCPGGPRCTGVTAERRRG